MTKSRENPTTSDDGIVEVFVPISFRKSGNSKRIVAPDGLEMFTAPELPNNTLVKALARAFRWRRLLEEGKYATLSELASSEKINPSYVSRILRLTLLTPDLVEAVLNGSHLPAFSLSAAMQPFPVDWDAQRRLLAIGN